MSQGTDGPPIWSELSITLNGISVTSPSFYAPTSAATGPGYILHWDDTNKQPVWTNILSVNHGGTGKSTWNQYGIIYANSTTSLTQVPNNTTNTRKFLRMVRDDFDATVPTWDTITKADVGLSEVENTKLSTWAGTGNIIKLGTITSGTWQGTMIAADKGGTGQSSWTKGQILYASAANTLSRLNIGTEGQILKVSSYGLPFWQTEYSYSLPLAVNGTRGGIQIGYAESGKNYAVKLDGEKAYVNVPWMKERINFPEWWVDYSKILNPDEDPEE